ncbi:hypothetical protein ACFSTC_08310 [Nonomuraea ferruginea]
MTDGRQGPDLTLAEVRAATDELLTKYFLDGTVTGLTWSQDGTTLAVHTTDGTHYFRPVVDRRSKRDEMARTRVRNDSDENRPHKVSFNPRVADDQLSRVWLHEITDTLQRLRADRLPVLRRPDPEQARRDACVDARLNEMAMLADKWDNAPTMPEKRLLALDIDGVARALRDSKHTPPLPPWAPKQGTRRQHTPPLPEGRPSAEEVASIIDTLTKAEQDLQVQVTALRASAAEEREQALNSTQEARKALRQHDSGRFERARAARKEHVLHRAAQRRHLRIAKAYESALTRATESRQSYEQLLSALQQAPRPNHRGEPGPAKSARRIEALARRRHLSYLNTMTMALPQQAALGTAMPSGHARPPDRPHHHGQRAPGTQRGEAPVHPGRAGTRRAGGLPPDRLPRRPGAAPGPRLHGGGDPAQAHALRPLRGARLRRQGVGDDGRPVLPGGPYGLRDPVEQRRHVRRLRHQRAGEAHAGGRVVPDADPGPGCQHRGRRRARQLHDGWRRHVRAGGSVADNRSESLLFDAAARWTVEIRTGRETAWRGTTVVDTGAPGDPGSQRLWISHSYADQRPSKLVRIPEHQRDPKLPNLVVSEMTGLEDAFDAIAQELGGDYAKIGEVSRGNLHGFVTSELPHRLRDAVNTGIERVFTVDGRAARAGARREQDRAGDRRATGRRDLRGVGGRGPRRLRLRSRRGVVQQVARRRSLGRAPDQRAGGRRRSRRLRPHHRAEGQGRRGRVAIVLVDGQQADDPPGRAQEDQAQAGPPVRGGDHVHRGAVRQAPDHAAHDAQHGDREHAGVGRLPLRAARRPSCAEVPERRTGHRRGRERGVAGRPGSGSPAWAQGRAALVPRRRSRADARRGTRPRPGHRGAGRVPAEGAGPARRARPRPEDGQRQAEVRLRGTRACRPDPQPAGGHRAAVRAPDQERVRLARAGRHRLRPGAAGRQQRTRALLAEDLLEAGLRRRSDLRRPHGLRDGGQSRDQLRHLGLGRRAGPGTAAAACPSA